jgi:hypothetical protein
VIKDISLLGLLCFSVLIGNLLYLETLYSLNIETNNINIYWYNMSNNLSSIILLFLVLLFLINVNINKTNKYIHKYLGSIYLIYWYNYIYISNSIINGYNLFYFYVRIEENLLEYLLILKLKYILNKISNSINYTNTYNYIYYYLFGLFINIIIFYIL